MPHCFEAQRAQQLLLQVLAVSAGVTFESLRSTIESESRQRWQYRGETLATGEPPSVCCAGSVLQVSLLAVSFCLSACMRLCTADVWQEELVAFACLR